jgi:predicted nucleic acid-binding protein
MNAEFIDTNILIYAHDSSAGTKHSKSVDLLKRLFESGNGALSIQVLSEFHAAATHKLGMRSEDAEEVLRDLETWNIHSSSHADLLRASRLHRRYKISWWDALIVNSAIQLDCVVLWTEHLSNGQRYERTAVRNPFV